MTEADITLARDANAIGQHWVLWRGKEDVVSVEGAGINELTELVNAAKCPVTVMRQPGRWHRWIAYGRHG